MTLSAETAQAAQFDLADEIEQLPLPYVEIDAHGIITRANRAAIALHHPQQGSLIGKSGWDLMSGGDKDFSASAFLAQLASGENPPVITRSLFDRSGKFRTYEMHRSFIRDAQGKPAGMRLVCVDITDTTNALNDARHARQWLESAMASVADAVVLTDILGVIQSANPAAATLSCFALDEMIGKTIEEVLPVVAFQPFDGVQFNHRTVIERNCQGVATVLDRQRTEVQVEMSTSPVLDHVKNSVIGVVMLLRKLEGAD